ncbi:MAG: cupin domain-containing protein [Chloroflexi bacterium]|nr:cupin domain-containing protein [Chloroflexota bacterium]
MEYLQPVDFAAFIAEPGARKEQSLLSIETAGIRMLHVPPGGGSPAGRHKHRVEQIFYIISGVMDFEIDGDLCQAGPGTLVHLPKGVPHRNWNGGTEPVVHLALWVPNLEPGETVAIPVE